MKKKTPKQTNHKSAYDLNEVTKITRRGRKSRNSKKAYDLHDIGDLLYRIRVVYGENDYD